MLVFLRKPNMGDLLLVWMRIWGRGRIFARWMGRLCGMQPKKIAPIGLWAISALCPS
jgi:hypothetical protein